MLPFSRLKQRQHYCWRQNQRSKEDCKAAILARHGRSPYWRTRRIAMILIWVKPYVVKALEYARCAASSAVEAGTRQMNGRTRPGRK